MLAKDDEHGDDICVLSDAETLSSGAGCDGGSRPGSTKAKKKKKAKHRKQGSPAGQGAPTRSRDGASQRQLEGAVASPTSKEPEQGASAECPGHPGHGNASDQHAPESAQTLRQKRKRQQQVQAQAQAQEVGSSSGDELEVTWASAPKRKTAPPPALAGPFDVARAKMLADEAELRLAVAQAELEAVETAGRLADKREARELQRAKAEAAAMKAKIEADEAAKSEAKRREAAQRELEKRDAARREADKVKAALQMATSGAVDGFASFESFDAKAQGRHKHELEGKEDVDSDSDSGSSEQTSKDSLFAKEWSNPPRKLMSREEIGDAPGEFVAHFVRYFVGAWQSSLKDGGKIEGSGLTDQAAAIFNSLSAMRETEEALRPLYVRLKKGEIGNEVLKQLDLVVSLAADRDYESANKEYLVITMGRKTWHNSLPQIQQQQNHGGSIRTIIKQSPLLGFDTDPVINAAILALKRLILFAQFICPPDDMSKRI